MRWLGLFLGGALLASLIGREALGITGNTNLVFALVSGAAVATALVFARRDG